MNKRLRSALVLTLFACASLLWVAPAQAQSVYGSIFGTVTDASGAAIPGATITVKDVTKGTTETATSNASGDYSVPHLLPDVYNLTAAAKGFQKFEATGISVLADTAPRIDPTLQVGGAATTITVNANQEPELKTASADVSTVFNQQQVSSLPVGDQNFTNLQLLLPGAQLLGWSHAADENPQGSRQIQVDGQAFGGTAFELDGTDNEDPILGIIVINPTLDSVTETKITTQNFDAELGKAVSAVVTAQTRSGTNSFHGDAYDFRTGNANLARDPYTEAPGPNAIPPGLKNRFGGSIGGPIMRDRAFFFANYEGQRQKVGTSATDTLPTNNLTESCLGNTLGSGSGGIAGCDFSEYKTQIGAAATIYDNSSGTPTPFQNNVIPTGMLSPQALALLTYLEPYTKNVTLGGQGNVNGLDSNYHASGTGLFNSNQWTERVDYTLNEKAHAFERFSRFTDVLSGAVMFGDAGGPGFGIGGYGGNSNGANDSLASGMDIAINPTLLTDFRLGYYRYNVIDSKHDQSTEFANTLGIPGINTGTYFTGGAPGFFIGTVPGGSSQPLYGDGLNVNRCNCPLTEREDQFQIVNNWTKILGNHTIKVGADLRYARNLRVPSDNDRDGLLNFSGGPTSDQSAATQGGLGFATFMLGDVTSYNRYVSTSTNAKEFQKRTFFYGQDTWRATRNLTLNLGVRWELYFPEAVNAAGNGSLLNLQDGYLHVAGIGGIPSDMGWRVRKMKQFAPRLGVTYQLGDKTVIRAGYGRSFDTGVFGSVFGHTVTQNLPVLTNQQINASGPTTAAFTLTAGPNAPVPVTVPSNGLLPNPGTQVSSKARPNPLNFPTIDAWNLSVQRALTPTMTLTVAYVGNKGTHTLGDGDGNSTNPNEAAIFLPGPNSFTGQTLHYDPTATDPANPNDSSAAAWNPSTGAVGTTNLLQRYYAAQLTACSDPNYASPGSGYDNVALPVGGCGWTNSIQYNGDNQNTEFDALQITLAQQMTHGLAYTLNYQWAAAFDEQTGFYTWDHNITHGRDSNTRKNQITWYGSYDLPFGHGKQFVPGASRLLDELIGGYQLSGVMSLSSGLPFTVSYNESGSNVPGSAPNWPNKNSGQRMKTGLTAYTPNGSGTGSRRFYTQQTTDLITDPGTGVFTNPGLDTIGSAGRNTYWGPGFFNTDLAVTKAFTIRENIVTKFRMDAFNAFNHINAGNPGGNIESAGTISSEAPAGVPRQLEFSLRVQF
ncbi:MAG TPA: TonB-dependent receptor [Terracidiphilus sp.]|nr:TonB-dependent receptor [Terracidiphilus sp.]